MKKELKKHFKYKIKFAKEYNFKGVIVSKDINDAIPLEDIPTIKQLEEIADKNCIKTLLLIDFVKNHETFYQSKEYA